MAKGCALKIVYIKPINNLSDNGFSGVAAIEKDGKVLKRQGFNGNTEAEVKTKMNKWYKELNSAKDAKVNDMYPAEVFKMQNEVANRKGIDKKYLRITRISNDEYEYSNTLGDTLAIYDNKTKKLKMFDSKTKDSNFTVAVLNNLELAKKAEVKVLANKNLSRAKEIIEEHKGKGYLPGEIKRMEERLAQVTDFVNGKFKTKDSKSMKDIRRELKNYNTGYLEKLSGMKGASREEMIRKIAAERYEKEGKVKDAEKQLKSFEVKIGPKPGLPTAIVPFEKIIIKASSKSDAKKRWEETNTSGGTKVYEVKETMVKDAFGINDIVNAFEKGREADAIKMLKEMEQKYKNDKSVSETLKKVRSIYTKDDNKSEVKALAEKAILRYATGIKIKRWYSHDTTVVATIDVSKTVGSFDQLHFTNALKRAKIPGVKTIYMDDTDVVFELKYKVGDAIPSNLKKDKYVATKAKADAEMNRMIGSRDQFKIEREGVAGFVYKFRANGKVAGYYNDMSGDLYYDPKVMAFDSKPKVKDSKTAILTKVYDSLTNMESIIKDKK